MGDPGPSNEKLVCKYSTGLANEPVVLHSGTIAFSGSDQTLEVEGKIVQRWLPEPQLAAEIELSGPSHPLVLLLLKSEHSVGITLRRKQGPTLVGRGHLVGLSGSKESFLIRIQISVLTSGSSEQIQSLTFHVVNFPSFREDPKKAGESGYVARSEPVRLIANDWLVRINRAATATSLTDQQGVIAHSGGWTVAAGLERSLERSLHETGGFGVTHVAQIVRADGGRFTPRAALRPLAAFQLFLSFARRRWTKVILTSGDNLGKPVWESWYQTPRIDPWNSSDDSLSSWGSTEDGMNRALPGFLRLWRSKEWKHPLQTAVQWLIDASSHHSAESALLGAQSALELLAWMHIVEKTRTLSRDGFDGAQGAR